MKSSTPQQRYKTLIAGLREFMHKKGMTIEALRDELNAHYLHKDDAVGIGSVYGWLAGRGQPIGERALALMEFFNESTSHKPKK